jgi:hypothetical protein
MCWTLGILLRESDQFKMAYPGYPGYGGAPGGFASPLMNPMGGQQIVGAGGWGNYRS